jgi:hypothetical protein
MALFAIILITLIYLFMINQLGSIPAARGVFGHGLGVLGFALMLMTETLYSFRKRSRRARWGRMSSWLKFHIFTGLVGPFLVLLHSSWKFNGLAGVVMLLTIAVVMSGVIGRYIYTAVPRTVDGAIVEIAELDRQVKDVENEFDRWQEIIPKDSDLLSAHLLKSMQTSAEVHLLVLPRFIQDWGQRLRWWFERRGLDPQVRVRLDELVKLTSRRRALERQRRSLSTARRLLSLWHAVHIPLGMVLFASAFVHIFAALYYATFLR